MVLPGGEEERREDGRDDALAGAQLLGQAQCDLGLGGGPRVDCRREHGASIRMAAARGLIMWVRGPGRGQAMVEQGVGDRKPGAAPEDHENEPQ